MKKIITLCLVITFSFINYAFAVNICKGIHMGAYSDANGISTVFCASYEDVEDSPEWDGNSENLPLSISEAMAIAKKWIKDNNPKLDDFEARNISIVRIGDSRIKNRWYFSIDFEAILDGRTLFGSPFVVKILMNGLVVEPEIVKN
ncbi:MAG: hypothetical protein JXL81_05025 [Deltaproteobacteria bacterium]|nr:hypothetical protein [Deltaproteobacteria bacterium]